jgi:hypothetical protein
MRKKIERRLANAERLLRKKHTNMFVIHIDGGLPGPIRCASAGGVHWPRAPDEPMEVFESRVIAEAKAFRASTVVFGGMCLCAWKDEASYQAYLNDPDFSLVPPEEIC